MSEGATATSGKWFTEMIGPDICLMTNLQKIVHSAQSEFQHIEIIESKPYGQCLMLDGKIQSSSFDEGIYHECLVHPALLAHPNPETVYVGGGGEGATVREILKHKTLKKVTMVDIDKQVVDVSKEYLSHHHDGGFDDPRTNLVIGDAKAYLEDREDKYDIIILDLADPLEGGPCYLLYTQNFYKMAKSKLNPGGILVTQSGPAGMTFHDEVFSPVNFTLRSVFPKVMAYITHIPSFNDMYGFNMASEDGDLKLSMEEVDKRIKERISKPLTFLDGEFYQNVTSLPKYSRDLLARETDIITENNPKFMSN